MILLLNDPTLYDRGSPLTQQKRMSACLSGPITMSHGDSLGEPPSIVHVYPSSGRVLKLDAFVVPPARPFSH